MSVEGLIAAFVILAVTVAFVGAPLLRRTPMTGGDDTVLQKQHGRLLVYYERVLTNIRDLDEDHATGKMQTADYQNEREEWMQRGIQVLKALDQVGSRHVLTDSAEADVIDRAIDRDIERAISAYRRRAH
jgi:hypothetical protein